MLNRLTFLPRMLLALAAGHVAAQSETPVSAAPAMTVVGPGHSALWFNPDRAAEGWVLEVLDQTRAVVYWFTLDEAGQQRWLIGVGDIVSDAGGEWIEFPELIVTRGGEFGAGFDPDQVELEVAGHAAMTFSSCDRGVVSYKAFGQEQTVELSRLSRTMAADCVAPIHGRPLLPITDDAGLTGSWFDPERAGEGFTLQWMDRDEVLVTWYTYDFEGNQLWMIGVGRREGDQIVIPELVTARGSRSGGTFDPARDDAEIEQWGELVLNLDCNAGTAAWSALAKEFGAGELELIRLTGLKRLDCPLTRPKLSELYDLELTGIPVTVPGGPTNNRATAMALDGTVVGYRPDPSPQGGNRAWRWRPGDPEVEELPGRNEFNVVLITPEGDSIVTTRRDPPDGGPFSANMPIVWRGETGWQPLSGLSLYTSLVRGISRDGTQVVGRGRVEQEDTRSALWVWNQDDGQRVVASEEDFLFEASAVSDDGRVVLGIRIDLEGPSAFTRRDRATRWIDGEAEFLSDDFGAWLRFPFGCAAECRIIFGGLQSADVDAHHPHLDEAWIWTEARGAEYLGTLPEAVDPSPYAVVHASADGSLLAGSFTRLNADGTRGARGFLWTRATGMQPLADLLAEFGISDSRWSRTRVADISPDGSRLLVAGRDRNTSESWASIIELRPKRQPHQ